MRSALYSHFIIDGVPQELTPAEILDVVAEKPADRLPNQASGEVVDETIDPTIKPFEYDVDKIHLYLDAVLAEKRRFPVPFAPEHTRFCLASALADTVWRSGNFKLDDLPITAKWVWNADRIGNMAAFYASVSAAADYIDNLNLDIRRYSCEDGTSLSVRFATPFSGAPRLVTDKLVPDPQSWLVYVPFDTSDYRLGGSLLAQSLGLGGGVAPQVADPDYLVDCYEVVRELVQDGIAISGTTVAAGGLIAAVDNMVHDNIGVTVDLSYIARAYEEKNMVRLLFAEVPGVLLQVRDLDFDYIDAEFLLQDVAFFPLGHPDASGDIHLKLSAKSGIQTILDSLMQNAEGED